MKWEKGRQEGCDYKKLRLWSFRVWKFGFDAYVLKYPPNADLPIHTDPVEKGSHYRFNLPLKGESKFYWLGGDSFLGKRTLWLNTTGPILFRPDLCKHFLRVGNKGCIKLSLGFVKFE